MKKSALSRMMKRMLAIILLSVIWVSGSAAGEYPSFYRGVRPLAMGGAFTAVADDENALYYNPAGLADISMLNMAILNPLVEASDGSVEMFQDLQDTDFENVAEAEDFLRKYIGVQQHLRMAINPYVGFNVANTGVMIAGLGQGSVDAMAKDYANPRLDVSVIGDYGLIGGVGGKLPFTGLRAGISLKAINRQSLEAEYTAEDLVSDDFEDMIEDDLNEGSGASADIGVIYTLPFVPIVDLDVGLAVLNFPNMDMGDALDINTQVNMGLAVKKTVAGFGFTGALDCLDLGQNIGEDDDWGKRLHLGAEIKFPIILSIQAGLNQGYPTGGVGIDFKVLRFDLATYGEEIGEKAGDHVSRRYVAQVTLGW
ncbi:MAG: hypothetical protein JRH03_04715 [Deltaproteobacteria bacterium]|nr:hypothetical protein [Deltaproteobacteria bacterium]